MTIANISPGFLHVEKAYFDQKPPQTAVSKQQTEDGIGHKLQKKTFAFIVQVTKLLIYSSNFLKKPADQYSSFSNTKRVR